MTQLHFPVMLPAPRVEFVFGFALKSDCKSFLSSLSRYQFSGSQPRYLIAKHLLVSLMFTPFMPAFVNDPVETLILHNNALDKMSRLLRNGYFLYKPLLCKFLTLWYRLQSTVILLAVYRYVQSTVLSYL